jgi:hypothetical protein
MTTYTHPTPIARDVIYRLPHFQQITNLGKAAMRQARRDGLRVVYIGNCGYVSGDDFHEFVERKGSKAAAHK